MQNCFQKYAKKQREYSEKCAAKYDTNIVFGTVKNVDPLEIEMETGDILPSNMFYPLPAVKTKKIRMIVHRMYGKPEIINIRGTATDVKGDLTAAIYNRSGNSNTFDLQFSSGEGTSGASTAVAPVEYSVANLGFNKWHTMEGGSHALSISGLTDAHLMSAMNKIVELGGDVQFSIEFVEKDGSKPKQNEHIQNQTTAIEGIIWQSMRVGDFVLMSSHNHGQKYLIHEIVNRVREIDDYEQANIWDSRYNDIPTVRDMNRVPTELPPKP